jgi:DnaJ homolog subfamily C member 7
LKLNPNLIEAMEKRALIHFKREEFEECVIECEEVLKKKDSPEMLQLKRDAEKEISSGEDSWYKVLKVGANATKEQVTKAYRSLIRTFHPDRARKAILSDKRKLTLKMAKIIRAKSKFDGFESQK